MSFGSLRLSALSTQSSYASDSASVIFDENGLNGFGEIITIAENGASYIIFEKLRNSINIICYFTENGEIWIVIRRNTVLSPFTKLRDSLDNVTDASLKDGLITSLNFVESLGQFVKRSYIILSQYQSIELKQVIGLFSKVEICKNTYLVKVPASVVHI